MSFRLKAAVLVGIAGAAVAVSTVALTGPSARAATERCGDYCVTMASQSFGTGQVIAEGANGGTLLAPGYNPQEDFVGLPVGTVSQLAGAGKIPAALAATYANEVVYQFVYQPAGKMTSTCLGASSLAAGSSITVQSCGWPFPTPHSTLPNGTLWVGIHRDGSGNFEPFINVAASTSSALALTASSGYAPLTLNYLSISNGAVAGDQMWESLIGIYGQTQPWPTPDGTEPSWPAR
jgi:hypothetical protein